jgi:hypothetical protein
MTEYVGTVETAKMIRKALKAKFPGTKFYVRSSIYSGGSSIDVRWENGPTANEVDRVVKPFEGSGFDGMIDMKYSKSSVMLADGTVVHGSTSGTEGSMGVVPSSTVELPEGAKMVHFSVDYVFTHREVSKEHMIEAIDKLVEKFGDNFEAEKVKESIGRLGYIERPLGDKDVTGEAGWNMHWCVDTQMHKILQETSYA